MDRPAPARARVDWVDYAKGLCIVMVVMMHSTLGVEKAAGQEGWMHAVVAFTHPFRMPDFFLIAGLFLGRSIDSNWRDFLDRKVVHFAYFYVLWLTIEFAVKAPVFATEAGWPAVGWNYLVSFIDPYGILWFIYLLPVFFVIAKLVRGIPPVAVWLVAAAIEIAHLETDWTVLLEARRFVFFYSGYLLAPYVFNFAAKVHARPWLALAGLGVWAVLNGALVAGGAADLPVVSLVLGALGAGAVVSAAALMVKSNLFQPLRYCGRHSLDIYLAFFLPMAAARIVLLRAGPALDIGTVSLLVTLAGVIGALAWYWAARGTWFRFLFERPAWARPKPARTPALQPAE